MNTAKATRWSVLVLSMLVATACASTRTQKSAGEAIDDAVVTTRVKAALIDNSTTKAGSIDVETFKGVVQLNGFVETSVEKSTASTVTRAVNGVKEVRNNLSVKAEPATAGVVIDDSTVTAKVKAALVESPDTKAYQVNVETRSGVVQLSGFVNNAAAKAAAATVARRVDGVKSVDNQIDVK